MNSHPDYEAEIRRLMDTLTGKEAVSKTPAEQTEEKPAKRFFHEPVSLPIDDLPLVLEEMDYEPSDAKESDNMEDDFEPILPMEDMMLEAHEDDFNVHEFARRYHHTQQMDREAGGYDDARRASFFGSRLWRQGDTFTDIVCKGLFWLLVLAVIVALGYGVYAVGVRPLISLYQERQLAEHYDVDVSGTVSNNEGTYPPGMLASFRNLYNINPQVSGYLQYKAAAQTDFLQIDYPVVYAGANTMYVNTNFYGEPSGDGALYLDERCNDAESRIHVVYGNNAASGKMFAGLNSLVGSVYNARAAATLTYSTLYEKHDYQVFAVVLADTQAIGPYAFDITRTDFASDAEWEAHMQRAKIHSLFDYGIDVTASDDVLVLVTDASPSVAKISNARVAVFARRARADNTALIVKNEDAVMPYAWYTAQNLTPHPYYTGTPSTTTTSITTTTQTTTATTASATTTTTTTTATQTSVTGSDDGVVDLS